MSRASELKDLRKQLRNVVKEILPEILNEEVYKKHHEKLTKDIIERMTNIQALVTQNLDEINKRSKDVTSYLVRQSLTPTPAAPPASDVTKIIAEGQSNE